MKDAKELLMEALDFLYDLRGAWEWRKDEPRCGYAKGYAKLDALIKQIEELEEK